MLTPDQVVPFLQHEDRYVREHAAGYLSKANDPSPATAEDFWRAIDRFGIEHSQRLLSAMRELPQTEASLRRTLDALRATTDDDREYHLQQAITWLDFPLLLAHRDDLLADEKLLPHVRDHLRLRIELAERPLDDVWDALARHSGEVDGKYWGEFDDRVSLRLIEAASRHGDPAAQRALERLRNGPRDDYIEIFCVQLLGRLRCVPATEVLVERLTVPDADILNQEAVTSLARIGTPEVVERLESAFPSHEWGTRLFIVDPLGRIKRPESERALLRLLPTETDPSLKTFIAAALCDLCSAEGLAAVHRMVLEDDYESRDVNLDELLVTVAAMVGFDFPELKDMRVRVDRERRERERRIEKWKSTDDVVAQIRDRWRRGEPPWAESRDDAGPPPGAAADWLDDGYGPSQGTYVRDEPKVGRNDPCPCGSGKKYKKCCLVREQA
jgi:hypothetical protein